MIPPTTRPLTHQETQRLYAHAVKNTCAEKHSQFLFGIALNVLKNQLYVIAIPHTALHEYPDGPNYLVAAHAFYVTGEGVISEVKIEATLLLMCEKNRWGFYLH